MRRAAWLAVSLAGCAGTGGRSTDSGDFGVRAVKDVVAAVSQAEFPDSRATLDRYQIEFLPPAETGSRRDGKAGCVIDWTITVEDDGRPCVADTFLGHELIHAVLQANGVSSGDHPAPYFIGDATPQAEWTSTWEWRVIIAGRVVLCPPSGATAYCP